MNRMNREGYAPGSVQTGHGRLRLCLREIDLYCAGQIQVSSKSKSEMGWESCRGPPRSNSTYDFKYAVYFRGEDPVLLAG